jgi:hypothetical protein
MKRLRKTFLVFRALYELVRYDAIVSLGGVGHILRQLSCQVVSQKSSAGKLERDICDAVLLATCFHWKPVLCLQRSLCTARLLKKGGVDARVVIGYRSLPFFSHAWVEVDGRVVYGSHAYRMQLRPLFVS